MELIEWMEITKATREADRSRSAAQRLSAEKRSGVTQCGSSLVLQPPRVPMSNFCFHGAAAFDEQSHRPWPVGTDVGHGSHGVVSDELFSIPPCSTSGSGNEGERDRGREIIGHGSCSTSSTLVLGNNYGQWAADSRLKRKGTKRGAMRRLPT